eukprot:NODE_6518_length_840_cov_141.403068_g6282_i0.p1 GENE.NODE_6518_length_840_cov_141.403068_g6282_i0~~NODE_6518_length_840_cov_141.403068_g6282_i0.p1  ORF type:complete len:232 (+),score=91.79 NODE_6518_length_840_cov_141.403068_g6282_i0:60-698(+)
MADKQIENMIAFITAEAKEKATEIEQEAQETYTIEKQRQIEADKKKIKAEFERKEKQVAVEKRIKQSNIAKEERLKVLKDRERLMQEMCALARKKLVAVTKNQSQYQAILASLIAQGAMSFKEGTTNLVVVGLAKDKQLLNSALPEAQNQYKKATGKTLNVTISDKALPEDQVGGVIVQSSDGRVKSINTLKSREETVVQDLQPRFRGLMFD